MATRRSGRRKRKPHAPLRDGDKSALQLQLETAVESPGGTAKVLRLVQTADDADMQTLNAARWTPLVGAIFRLGKNTTRHGNSAASEGELEELVRACHARGISPNSGAWFGDHLHRPLVVAAYYGYHEAVRRLIELGALPDMGDGEGRNAWHAAFENPVARKGLRKCDKRTAQMLLELGAVTKDLGRWRRSPKGTLCYMNGDSSSGGSILFRAIENKSVEVAKFVVAAGGSLTDRDYLTLRNRSWVKSRLIPMMREVLRAEGEWTVERCLAWWRSGATSWSREKDWSFPPTWQVGVVLCQNCGLPPEIFRTYVVPYLSRDWFYTRSVRVPPPLGPSCGERV